MRHRMLFFFFPLMAAFVWCTGSVFPSSANAQPEKAPQIGQPAPTFTLPDVHGHSVRLQDFKGKKNVLLVFYRGWVGYW